MLKVPQLRHSREGKPLSNALLRQGGAAPVVPVETGTHPLPTMDSRLRGNDEYAAVDPRLRRPLHNRHSREGGNPGVGSPSYENLLIATTTAACKGIHAEVSLHGNDEWPGCVSTTPETARSPATPNQRVYQEC